MKVESIIKKIILDTHFNKLLSSKQVFTIIFCTLILTCAPWFEPKKISDKSIENQYFSTVMAIGNLTSIIWQDESLRQSQLFFAKSSDLGKTWSNVMPVFSNVSRPQHTPSISSHKNNLILAWTESSEEKSDIFFSKSYNYGNSWVKPLQINLDSETDNEKPIIHSNDDDIVIIWQKLVNETWNIVLSTSNDFGTTWSVETTVSQSKESHQQNPKIASSNSHIFAIWQQWSDERWKIVFSSALHSNKVFAPEISLSVNVNGSATNPDIFLLDNRLIAVWQQFEDDSWNIYSTSSNIGDLLWSVPELILNNNSGFQINPQLYYDGRSLFIVWQDNSLGQWEIASITSTDKGEKFRNRHYFDVSKNIDKVWPDFIPFNKTMLLSYSLMENNYTDVYFARKTNDCNDNVANGDESDIDCGGSCNPCRDGNSCYVNSDCKGNNCNKEKKCRTETCYNEAKDLDESDVDCGGSICLLCPLWKQCSIPGDCESSNCLASNLCGPPDTTSLILCADGIKNQDETDIDCGGSVCAFCDLNKDCFIDTDCMSLNCLSNNTCGERPQEEETIITSIENNETEIEVIKICEDGICVADECSICPQDCSKDECNNNSMCDSTFGENCQTYPNQCKCDRGSICAPKKLFSNENGCYILKCGNGVCDTDDGEDKESCCIDCGAEPNYCKTSVFVEQKCDNQKNEITMIEMECEGACDSKKGCIPCRKDDDCFKGNPCSENVCDKEQGVCVPRHLDCGLPCGFNKTCDGEGNCVDPNTFCFCNKMCPLGQLCNMKKLKCEIADTCGNNACDVTDCFSCPKECGAKICGDNHTCDYLLGEHCGNTPECICESGSVCAPDRPESAKNGCYILKCGDSFCDKGESDKDCCKDCPCTRGECFLSENYCKIDESTICSEEECTSAKKACHIKKTNICLNDQICNNDLGEDCSNSGDCLCSVSLLIKDNQINATSVEIKLLITNTGNSADNYTIEVDGPFPELRKNHTVFIAAKQNIEIDWKFIVPKINDKSEILKKYHSDINEDQYVVFVKVKSTTKRGSFGEKDLYFNMSERLNLIRIAIISLGIFVIILIIGLVGVFIKASRQKKMIVEKIENLMYDNADISPEKVNSFISSLILVDRSVNILAPKEEVISRIIRIDPLGVRLHLGHQFENMSLVQYNRKKELFQFSGKDKFLKKNCFIEIIFYGKEKDIEIEYKIYSHSDARSRLISEHIKKNLKIDRTGSYAQFIKVERKSKPEEKKKAETKDKPIKMPMPPPIKKRSTAPQAKSMAQVFSQEKKQR